MKRKSGITLTMLIIYIVVLAVIMGAVVLNLGNNDQIKELDKVTYQAKVLDYIEQFETMKDYYTLKGEYNDEIMVRQNEKDIYGRTITDYIASITMEDKKYFCIYNGELHTYAMDIEDTRYVYIQELGLTQIEYIPPADNKAPVVEIWPNVAQLTNNVTVRIKVSDNNQLASNNIYQYYLSTSRETQIGGSWITYTSGTPFTIGTNLTGTYYLHIKEVYDSEGNTSGNVVSGGYTFDNTKPSISINISEKNNIYNMQISLSDNVGLDFNNCKYVLKQNNISLGANVSNYTDGFLLAENVEFQAGICGQYYLHVIATDLAGNTRTYVSNIIEGTNTQYGNLESETKYNYTGNIQTVNLSTGVYKLEVWGASGGNDGTGVGGKGGYSSGMLSLVNSNNVFIGVGGVGASSVSGTGGGYNGGGNAGNSGTSGAGGGATHIVTGTNRGVLTQYESYKNEVLIVAGAGGGGGNSYQTVNGGYGGGTTREVPGGANAGDYAFGQGQTRVGDGGAGGSGWYGGYASNGDGGGAGGIGYISPVLKNAQTIEGNKVFASLEGGTETGHSGNGCAKITKYLPGYQLFNDNTQPSINVNISENNNIYNIQIALADNVGLDFNNCKYVLKQNNISLGANVSNYTDGVLTKQNTELKVGICGQYYLHVIATDIVGNTRTYVSNIIEGTNTQYGNLESETKYNYTGNIQTVNLSTGVYKLEVWGASGGSDGTGGVGGKGGYSSGMLSLANSNNVFIGVGGVGASSVSGTGGGYNGGGNAGNSGSSGAGGGATHIATGTNRGVLTQYESYKNEVLIVAGAGGGGGNSYQTVNGGYGGGTTREVPGGANAGDYAFGQGQTRVGDGGAGGSGWYGGYASNGDGGGAGGIGYISPVLKNAQTIEGNKVFASLEGGTETGHSGNGCAKITKYLSSYRYIV